MHEDGATDTADPCTACSDQHYREIVGAGLDLLAQGILVLDERLRIVAWNTAFLHLQDLPAGILRPCAPLQDLIRDCAASASADLQGEIAARLAAAGQQPFEIAERIQPDGRTLAVRGFPLPRGGYIIVYTDITAERQAREQIARHETELEEHFRERAVALAQAQKMEAIGQLTGGLAHDFNNLLTVVIGNLVALKDSHPNDALIENFVEPAMQAANRGAELIRRLLGFARRQPLEPRPVEVNELILDMSKLFRRSLPASIAIGTASRTPCLVALVDAHQLENALLNLALNARDAMPNGGELRIESSLEHLSPATAADLELPAGDYVQIAVSDNGMGMDSSTLARVFEPFFTTKQFGMGSGLGLSMVYGFAKQSGGGVRIRSRQALGTTVALLLPRVEEEQPATAAAAGQPGGADGMAGKLVLLADDDADVRAVVRMQLAELGCAVVEAENGAEAADMVENIPAIALVISDVVMPGTIDGWALARFVRRFRPELLVVMMSGFAESHAGRGRELNLPLLAKPFSRDKLLAVLRPHGA
jgi:signal transduction histidine kinase/CheY-like chemotaxis protein